MSRREPPATLPADFFSRIAGSGASEPARTLPADFFNRQAATTEPTVPAVPAGPAPDARTAREVAMEQADRIAPGVFGAITGIPGAIAAVGGAGYDMLAGKGSKAAQDLIVGGVKGAVQPFTTSARGLGALVAPGKVNQPSREEFETAAQGSGAMLGAAALPNVLSRVKTAASPGVAAMMEKAPAAYRQWRYGPIVQQIEQKLAGSGKENKAVTIGIAEKLADDPILAKSPKGPKFDEALFGRFKRAGAAIESAEQTIPPGTMVQRNPLLSKIDAAIKELEVMTPAKTVDTVSSILDESGKPIVTSKIVQDAVSGHPDALRALKAARAELSKFGDSIPFHDLRKYRQQLDRNIKTTGGFKETASAADRATMEANRFVVNSIRGGLSDATSAMGPANAEYSLMRKAIEAAGLDFETGRRIANIGKVPPSLIIQLAKAGMLGAGGYTAYRILGIND